MLHEEDILNIDSVLLKNEYKEPCGSRVVNFTLRTNHAVAIQPGQRQRLPISIIRQYVWSTQRLSRPSN